MVINFCRFVFLFIFSSFIFSNNFSIDTAVVQSGDDFNLNIYLDNIDEVAGFEFTLSDYPNEIAGVSAQTLGRTEDFSVYINEVDGELSVVCFSITGAILEPGNDAILSLSFSSNPQPIDTDIQIQFNDIVIADLIGDSLVATSDSQTINLLGASPQNLTTEVTSDGVLLDWDMYDSDILNYNIYRDNNLIASLDPEQNSYVDTQLNNEGVYCYTVSANFDIGESAMSNMSCLYLDLSHFGFTPNDLSALAGVSGQIELSWSEPDLSLAGSLIGALQKMYGNPGLLIVLEYVSTLSWQSLDR